MSLLHYTTKSGANGMGDIAVSCRLLRMLIDKGIDVNAKCRWTDMTSLHLAVFFDIEEIVQILLEATKLSGKFAYMRMLKCCFVIGVELFLCNYKKKGI